ncbi:MAG: type IV pilin N-terminal domain-containing protein [Candidatus Heimdallarchaeota archaeon]|nr:type IV pilin N-terminal domain-containing protein [Candidatus Heimdallarchaeota archaeon]MBY8994893.1 type IV pilin N-terminal domain-containing protein [Candidatus Heimdallarchaeota archaeon]
MFTKILNKIFPRKKGNKRGVSPVIATILLIALTVTAAAIVYFVVVPLLQGKGEIVQMSGVTLTDDDVDGFYDTATIKLFNLGTDLVTLNEDVTLIIYSPTENTTSWLISSNLEFLTQETKEITIVAIDDVNEMAPLSQYEMSITYGSKSITTGRQFSSYGTGGESGPEPPVLNYTAMAMYLRTAAEDPSTSRASFPTTSGYSPALWFISGIYKSGTSNLQLDTTDYIASNGFGAAEDYRPYLGITDTFSTDISAHTGYQNLAYNDTGNYPGCVTFSGTSFDAADTFNWPQKGIAYMYSYIYNPTPDAMDLSISIQVDDAYYLWVNGDLLGSGTQVASGWKTWRTPVTVTLNPGYNVITVKASDAGGNWDAQVLMWDTGTIDDITGLLNVWPLVVPTSTFW